MHWITIILIGIASNLDNLFIGLAYGVKQVKIPVLSNVIIALVSMVVTYVAVTAGTAIIEYISVHMANVLGSLLLCIIGLWTLFSKKFSKQGVMENSELCEGNKNHIITFKEAFTLGFVLSVNCVGGGIAIGANGISVIWTVLSIGIFSFLTVAIGSHFGVLLSKTFIGKYSTAISGGLLIIIGIFELFA